MRKFKHILFFTFASLMLAVSSFAADVRMSVEPQLIGLLDRAVLKIEFIDTKGDAVQIPQVDGLNIKYQGQSSETRIVNLKRTSKIIHNYLITPTKVGDYTIGPVECTYKGGKKTVSALLRVIKPKDDQEALEISKMLFSEISTDRTAPYVYEPFGLTLKVYVKDGMQTDGSFSLRGGMPESGVDGEFEWKVTNQEREERDGSIFNVYTLKTTAKTLTAGTFIFQPEVQLNIIIPRQRRRTYGFDDPFFGDFFGRQEARAMVLECNRLAVKVHPVPMTGRPDEYTGGVGILDFDVQVGPDHVKAGEPITVKMRISGNGNLEKITPPAIATNHNIKLYEPRSLPTGNPNEVCFEQVIIPKSGEITEIPPITFSYFNTQTTDFRTITKGPFSVSVEDVPQQVAQVIATVPSTIQVETKILGRDIVYLKPSPKTWQQPTAPSMLQHKWFNYLLLIPAACLALVYLVTSNRNRLSSNVALSRRQKAPKAARRNIKRATAALRRSKDAEFYEALWDALTEYFGHRFNLAPGDVTLETVLARVPKESEAIESLFNTTEQRRYGIGDAPPMNEKKALLKQLTSTLKKCERMKL